MKKIVWQRDATQKIPAQGHQLLARRCVAFTIGAGASLVYTIAPARSFIFDQHKSPGCARDAKPDETGGRVMSNRPAPPVNFSYFLLSTVLLSISLPSPCKLLSPQARRPQRHKGNETKKKPRTVIKNLEKTYSPHRACGVKKQETVLLSVSTTISETPWSTYELAALHGCSPSRAKTKQEDLDQLIHDVLAPSFVARGTRADQATASIRAVVARLHRLFEADERTTNHVTHLIKLAYDKAAEAKLSNAGKRLATPGGRKLARREPLGRTEIRNSKLERPLDGARDRPLDGARDRRTA